VLWRVDAPRITFEHPTNDRILSSLAPPRASSAQSQPYMNGQGQEIKFQS
jgi:hypothetical protein